MKTNESGQDIIQDLCSINRFRIMSELFTVAFCAWVFYVMAILASSKVLFCLVYIPSTILLYRGLSFIHEVNHLEAQISNFRLYYNLLFGFPMRVPAYAHKTHKYHHSSKTFASVKDPEYLPWTNYHRLYLFRPLILSFFYPVFLALRFGIWPLVLMILPEKYRMKTYLHASTFVMNLKYIRPFKDEDYRVAKSEDKFCSLYFIFFIIIASYFNVLFKASLIMYSQIVIISIMNTYRALVAHRYTLDDRGDLGRDAQVMDSVTIEGSFLTAIWAPIGLRYHSTHHLFPHIPYYNLAKAHYRLKSNLRPDHPYHFTVERSFLGAFAKLLKACKK